LRKTTRVRLSGFSSFESLEASEVPAVEVSAAAEEEATEEASEEATLSLLRVSSARSWSEEFLSFASESDADEGELLVMREERLEETEARSSSMLLREVLAAGSTILCSGSRASKHSSVWVEGSR
jgi:hypothetical protein